MRCIKLRTLNLTQYRGLLSRVKKELRFYEYKSVSLAAGLSHATVGHWMVNKHHPREENLLNVAWVLGVK